MIDQKDIETIRNGAFIIRDGAFRQEGRIIACNILAALSRIEAEAKDCGGIADAQKDTQSEDAISADERKRCADRYCKNVCGDDFEKHPAGCPCAQRLAILTPSETPVGEVKQEAPSEEEMGDAFIEWVKGERPLEMHRQSFEAGYRCALRSQLAERMNEHEALVQISQLERQVPYASAHGFVEYSLKKIGDLARAALAKAEVENV